MARTSMYAGMIVEQIAQMAATSEVFFKIELNIVLDTVILKKNYR